MSTTTKAYWDMTAEELAEATKEFDGPLDETEWHPISDEEREKLERERDLPSISLYLGKQRELEAVDITLDGMSLRRARAAAERRGLTLTTFIRQVLTDSLPADE